MLSHHEFFAQFKPLIFHFISELIIYVQEQNKIKLYLDTFLSSICYSLEIADNECHKIGTHLYALFEVVCTELD